MIIAFLSGCTKDDIISDNVAPPDGTIEDVTITNYINRVYISVLGREADSAEKVNGFSLLRNTNLSYPSRIQFLDSVFSRDEYNEHLYTLARIDLLNNFDTADIPQIVFNYTLVLQDTDYMAYWPQVQNEIIKLDSLRSIPQDLESNLIGIVGLHTRCANNYFYDQINMGTENFVVSCFQNFLNRYPTDFELDQSKSMVDGGYGSVFLQAGQSKDDFLRIFFSSNDYYEGLVVNLYERYIFHNPSSTEMTNATLSFAQNHDYILMQKNILSSNAYIFR